MIKVALKGLAGRKVRALLTALAVVIGVSMVSGTFVLTDTMQKAFDGIFDESYEGTDAVVSGKQLVDFSSGGRATVPARLLEQVKDAPVRRGRRGQPAGPAEQLQRRQAARPATARSIGRQGETLGVGIDDAGRQFSPLKLKQGEWAHGDGEIVLDAGTASKHALRGRRHDPRRRQRPGRSRTRSPGIATLRLGRLARRRLAGHLRPPDRAGAVREAGRVRQRSRSRPRTASRPAALTQRDQAAAARRPPRSRPATRRPRRTPRTPTRA